MDALFVFNLGDRVKDQITGFTGIVTSRSEHLYGCARYWICPQELKDGKPIDGCWMDEPSLQLVEAGAIKSVMTRAVVPEEPQPLRRTGGPINQPPSHSSSGSR